MDYVKFFEELEKSREAGNTEDALLKSQVALLEAANIHDPVLAINALSHQLLIFKDKFTNTGDEFYLHLMHAVAQSGISMCDDLAVSGQPKAVMFLRSGDYYFHLKKYPESVKSIQAAVDELGGIHEEKPGEYAEYLSHLGKAKVFVGDESGLRDLQEACELTAGQTELREFHQKAVHSGNLARLAIAYNTIGKTNEVLPLLKQIAPIARDLKDNHNMPMRWQELVKACGGLGVSIDELF